MHGSGAGSGRYTDGIREDGSMRIGNSLTELKPCPFCGGEAYLEDKHRAFIKGQSTRVAYVRCRRCNARTERFELQKYGGASHSAEAERLAVEAWNRRVGA